MDFEEKIKKFFPELDLIYEQSIVNAQTKIVGWHSTIKSKNNHIFGGTHCDRMVARKIALAEFLERMTFFNLIKSPLAAEYKLDSVPTTSGFAAGFENKSTAGRALCEGLERWVWSKWIDSNFYINEIEIEKLQLTSLGKHLYDQFNKVRWFEKKIKLDIPEIGSVHLKFLASIGYKDNGVFPGSRVSLITDDEISTHPLIESWRNLNNFYLHQNNINYLNLDSWMDQRIEFFGRNASNAENQIAAAFKMDWPVATISLLKAADTKFPDYYVWRCLFDDYIPWHVGNYDRFVY